MSFYEWFNKKFGIDLNDFKALAEMSGCYEEWIEELLMILYNHLYCNGNKEKARPFEVIVEEMVNKYNAWLEGEIDCIV